MQTTNSTNNNLTEQIEAIKKLILFLGDDPEREGLQNTPSRIIESLLEMTKGTKQNPEEILSTTFSNDGYDQLIILDKIPFTSLCEHHLLPFTGFIKIGYIPGKRIVGISKLPRLVDCFAKRLQIQERLTKQIAEAIKNTLNPLGVAVQIKATHQCVSLRGIEKDAVMITNTFYDKCKEKAIQEEFLVSTN